MSSTSKSNAKIKQQCQMKQQERNWLELPSDVTSKILHRIGVIDILENAQKVCTTWRRICKDPALWRVVYMDNVSLDPNERPQLREMCKHAVDRSHGQLVDLTIVNFADDELLDYVAGRSSQLRRLEVACCHGNMYWSWMEVLKKLPLLEELALYSTGFRNKAFETAARHCPMLRTLKINEEPGTFWDGGAGGWHLAASDGRAKAIGENLPELRHLELIGDHMSDTGLQAILDGCHHLESLDLRQCFYIKLEGYVWEKCSEKIECVKLPKDSLDGCPYIKGVNPETRDFNELQDSDIDYSDLDSDEDDDYPVPCNFGAYDSDDDFTNIDDLEEMLTFMALFG